VSVGDGLPLCAAADEGDDEVEDEEEEVVEENDVGEVGAVATAAVISTDDGRIIIAAQAAIFTQRSTNFGAEKESDFTRRWNLEDTAENEDDV